MAVDNCGFDRPAPLELPQQRRQAVLQHRAIARGILPCHQIALGCQCHHLVEWLRRFFMDILFGHSPQTAGNGQANRFINKLCIHHIEGSEKASHAGTQLLAIRNGGGLPWML